MTNEMEQTGDQTQLAQWAADMGAIATGATAFDPDEDAGMVSVVEPEGYHHRVIDLERYRAHPRRASGTVTVRDGESFKRYVRRFVSPAAAIFANSESRTITCVLNYHEPARDNGGQSPGWGDHRVVMELRQTPRWKEWREFAAKRHTQEAFAWFLEQRAGDVVEPDGSDVYTLVRDLKVTKSVTYEKTFNEQNGAVQLVYHEDVAGANRTSKMEVPERMTISVVPYEGDDPMEATGFLRYRIEDGKCWFSFELGADVEEALQGRFDDVVSDVAGELGVDLFLGPAPSAVQPVERG